jgi:hypothetical protein
MSQNDPNDLNNNGLVDLLKASYQGNKKASELGANHNLTLDQKLSNSEHKVFYDPENKRSTVVYTGSRKAGDWVTDGLLAVGLGKYTKRYADSQKVLDKTKKKYGDDVTTAGHSLGGYLAENVKGAKNRVTVNKAVGLGGIGTTVRKNQTDYVVDGDAVSTLSSLQKYKGNYVRVPYKGSSLLNAHKFTQLKKLRK